MTREQAINYLISSGFSEEQVSEVVRALTYEPTTKNYLSEEDILELKHRYGDEVEFVVRDMLTGEDKRWDKLPSIEPTTKNNLGVDCISRAEVLKLMQDNWHTHNGDWAMQESMDDIRALPSVTPQEPTGKNFTKADIDAIIKAINDGWELRVNEVLDKIRAEIIKYEGDCRLSVDEYPSCRQCTDNVLETIYGIIDKYKAEIEPQENEG